MDGSDEIQQAQSLEWAGTGFNLLVTCSTRRGQRCAGYSSVDLFRDHIRRNQGLIVLSLIIICKRDFFRINDSSKSPKDHLHGASKAFRQSFDVN